MKTQQKRVFRAAIKPKDPAIRFATVRQKVATVVTKVSTSLGVPAPPKMIEYLRGKEKKR